MPMTCMSGDVSCAASRTSGSSPSNAAAMDSLSNICIKPCSLAAASALLKESDPAPGTENLVGGTPSHGTLMIHVRDLSVHAQTLFQVPSHTEVYICTQASTCRCWCPILLGFTWTEIGRSGPLGRDTSKLLLQVRETTRQAIYEESALACRSVRSYQLAAGYRHILTCQRLQKPRHKLVNGCAIYGSIFLQEP